jgi:PASTA domain-containing protein
VKFTAQVAAPDGPVKSASVEIVGAEGGTPTTIGKGMITDGVLSADADAGAVWGVWIDKRAVIAFPVSSTAEVVDLGEIVLVGDGLPWPAFHAPDGRVYGVPRAAVAKDASAGGSASATPVTSPRMVPIDEPMPRVVSKMTFGDLVGNTARQLADAATTVRSNFVLSGATVTLKGVPSGTEDAISLEFPTSDVAASGVGLSELSFSIRPTVEAPPPQPTQPAPSGSPVPDLTGYTRELAVRKAAAAGFIAEVNNAIVTDAAEAGRVIRQRPEAGSALASHGVIRLYIGKRGGS